MHFGFTEEKSRRGTVYGGCITMWALMSEISEQITTEKLKPAVFDNTIIWRPLSWEPREYSHKSFTVRNNHLPTFSSLIVCV